MNVGDFEERVWELEAIRIVIRASAATQIGDYGRQNAAPETQSVTEWIRTRITPNAGGHDVIVLGGNGEEPHGRTLIRTLRESYLA